jgi:hypothetical protein
MYLADHEIKVLSDELQIAGPNPEHPFEPERQIQPCSIDLRISDVFWKPRRRRQLWRRLIMLIPLASEPERSYGDAELRSKYANDEGGPSLWWRDARVEELQQRLGQADAHEAIRQDIVERVRFQSTEVLARFQRDIDRQHVGKIENADQVLDEFARREDRRRLTDRVVLGSPLLFAGGLIASVFAAFGIWTVVLIALTLASSVAAFVAYERRDDGYLGTSDLRALPPPDGKA